MTQAESVGVSSERLARLPAVIEKHIGPDKLAGVSTLIARKGEIVQLGAQGFRDRETSTLMTPDTLFRIYSMTKPITCIALMTLYEQGKVQLMESVANFIPKFADLKVYKGQSILGDLYEDLARPVTVRDLLTHTSGLSYHIFEYGAVEAMYREAQVCSPKPLAEFVEGLLEMPLAFQPGSAYRYSFAHDVVARLVEVISAKPFDVYLKEALFEPLGMQDTGFFVHENKQGRFAAMYGHNEFLDADMTFSRWAGRDMPVVQRRLYGANDCLESKPHNVLRGGHGLVSTVEDYYKFAQMLLNGGHFKGQRILSRKTIELITANHLPASFLPYEIGGNPWLGYGYGLGLRTLMDLGQVQLPGSLGEFGWAGAAGTYFWIDPKEDLIGIMMTQMQPAGISLVNQDFRTMAYQAIVD